MTMAFRARTEAGVSGSQCDDQLIAIEGVDRYRVVEPVFEGIRVILSARGETYSPAYIQGISGAAFRIAGPCPCAPTCTCAMTPEALIETLGYSCDTVPPPAEGAAEVWLETVVARIRDEVLRDRPVLVFHAFSNAEWDVVCGFNARRKRLAGRGAAAGTREYARADERRMLGAQRICGIVGPTFIGDRVRELDARSAELAALREAVRHARSNAAAMPYTGLQCYERWIDVFRANPGAEPDFGRDGYTSSIYRSTHRAAAGFLRELRPRYPEAAHPLEEGAGYMGRAAHAMCGFHDLLFPRHGDEAADPRERDSQARVLLTRARDAYDSAILHLERAVHAIETAH